MKTISPAPPDAAESQPEAESRNSRLLYKIVSASTALSFGCAVASIQALRSSSAGFSFKFSLATVVAFGVGVAIAMLFWRLVDKGGIAKASVLLIAVGLALFLYPLRFVPSRSLPEIAVGLVGAAFALSVLGFLLWRVKKFLDADAGGSK